MEDASLVSPDSLAKLRRVLYMLSGDIDEPRLHEALRKARAFEGTRLLYEACGHYLVPPLEITREENERLIDDLYSTPKFSEGINVCTRCGHNITTSVQKQMRSADEGTDFLVTCQRCHFRWRVRG